MKFYGTYSVVLTPTEEVVFLFQVRAGLARPCQVEFPAGSLKDDIDPIGNVAHELADEIGSTLPITLFS